MAEQEVTPMVSHEGAAPTPQQVGVNCVRVFGVLQILLSLLYLASCKAADFAAGVYTAFGFGMWGGIWVSSSSSAWTNSIYWVPALNGTHGIINSSITTLNSCILEPISCGTARFEYPNTA